MVYVWTTVVERMLYRESALGEEECSVARGWFVLHRRVDSVVQGQQKLGGVGAHTQHDAVGVISPKQIFCQY